MIVATPSAQEMFSFAERHGRWHKLWESAKNTPKKWAALRTIYSELTPRIMEHRVNPYFINWNGVFTPIEMDMWQYIRSMGLPLYPQYPVGRFFVDFGDPVKKIAFECDGKEWHDAEKDAERDCELLDKHGWTVYRFTGSELWVSQDDERSPFNRLLELRETYWYGKG